MRFADRTRYPVLLLVAALACTRPTLAAVAVSQAAPDFTLNDLDGRPVSLAGLRGKVVVLEWINPNCPVSRGHAERHTMIDTSGRHPEAVWLGINSTNPRSPDHLAPAAHQRYDAEHGITYPVLEDPSGTVGRAYGARTTPHMFVIDAQGKIAYEGAIDDRQGANAGVNYVDAALSALAAGRRPDPGATVAYGCSIKY